MGTSGRTRRSASVRPLRLGPAVVPAEDVAIAVPVEGAADGAGLAHPGAVAPAAAGEHPGGFRALDDEHAAVEVLEPAPDGQLAVDADGGLAALDAQRAGAARD